MLDTDSIERFSNLSRVPRVRHGFAAACAFGGFDADREDDRTRLQRKVCPQAEHLARTTQTHSSNVAIVSRAGSGVDLSVVRSRSSEAFDQGIDGLVTREPRVLCHAISADCPLLVLATADGSAVGLAHCGWRGVARGIVGEVVDRIRELAGCAPSRLVGAISPGAGECCYEVGDDVIAAMREVGVAVDSVLRPYRRGDGRTTRALDLKAAIAQLAMQRGVPSTALEISRECSICGGDRFHSYRRQGRSAGRMAAVIARLDEV